MTPFPSLESLTICNMPCWEEWSSFDSRAFSVLKDLKIHDCPKLKGDLPHHLPALETLTIEKCELLVSSLPNAPTLRRLQIATSNEVPLHVFPLSVEFIEVEGSPTVESMVEAITSIQPSCLQSLTLKHCSSAMSLPVGHLPASLRTLTILSLKNLEFQTRHKHESLESLSIYNSCDSLMSLPLVPFPNLKSLRIENCENMKSLLVSGSESIKSLSSFQIIRCPSLASFPREGLPAPNLIRFKGEKLKSLPDQMSSLLPKLEHLGIYECPDIESFPEDHVMASRRECCLFPFHLSLFGFSSMVTLDCKCLLHFTSLQKLEIPSCQKLPDSLIKLSILSCPLLQKRLMRRHIWPIISHISGIYVDGK